MNNTALTRSQEYIEKYGSQALLRAINELSKCGNSNSQDAIFWQKVCDHISDDQPGFFMFDQ